MEFIKVGFYIYDIIVLVFLVMFLLGGFLKGWKKTLFNLIAFLVPFIIYMLMANSLAKVLLNIEWPVIGKIETYILNNMQSTTPSEEMIELVRNLSAAVIKLAIYYVGLILCLLISIINKIIFKITLKKFFYPDGNKKAKPSTPSKLIGLGIGFGRFVLATVVLSFPIFGVLNVAQTALKDYQLIDKMSAENSEYARVSEEEMNLDEIYDLLGTSISYKTFTLIKSSTTQMSLPAQYLGSIMSVKTDNGSYNLINEYGNIHAILNVVSRMEITDEYVSFENLTDNDIKILKKAISDIKILKLVSPLAKDIIIDELNKNTELENKEEIIDLITNLDIDKEIDIILDATNSLIDLLKGLKISINNPEDILLEPSLSNVVENVLRKLVSSTIVKEYVLPIACENIIKQIDDKTGELEKIINADNLETCIKSDVSVLIGIYQNMATTNNLHNFIFNKGTLIVDTPDAASVLESSIDKIFDLSIVKGNEKSIIIVALDKTEQEDFTYEKLFKDLDVNWQEESKILGALVKEILLLPEEARNFENYDIKTLTKKAEDGKYLYDSVIKEIAKSQMFRVVGINLLEIFKDSNEEFSKFMNLLNFEEVKKIDENAFYNELISLLDIVEIVDEINFNGESLNLTEETVEALITKVFNSCFIKDKENEIVDFILKETGINDTLVEMNITISYTDIDWETEPEKLINIFKALLKFGDITSIDINKLLENRTEETNDNIVNLFVCLRDSKLFEPVLFTMIDEMVKELNYTEVTDLLNFNALKTLTDEEFKQEILNLLDIVDLIEETGFTTDTVNLTEETVEALITNIFDSVLIKSNEEEVVKFILKETGINDKLVEMNITISYTDVNWETEPEKLINIFKALLKFGDITSIDINKLLENRTEETNDNIVNLFVCLRDSKLFEPALFTMIDEMVKDLGYNEVTDYFDFDALKTLSNDEFKKELLNLLDIIDLVEETGFTTESLVLTKETISEVIDKVFSSCLIKGNEAEIVDVLFKEAGLYNTFNLLGVTINVFDEEINWETEPNKLKVVLQSLLDFGDINSINIDELMVNRNDENKTKVVNLFNAFDESQIFRPIAFKAVEEMVSRTSYNITITPTDQALIRANTWEKEVDTLFKIINQTDELLGDEGIYAYTTIPGDKVKDLMILASESVIASKALGTTLNEMLGEENLNINPKVEGKYKYDFTNQETLKNEADNISNLIELKRLVDTSSTTDDQVVESVVNIVKDLSQDELTEDLLNGIFTENNVENIESIDFNEEATLIENSYKEYKDSASVSEATLAELEDSVLAKEVLKKLGIIE